MGGRRRWRRGSVFGSRACQLLIAELQVFHGGLIMQQEIAIKRRRSHRHWARIKVRLRNLDVPNHRNTHD